MKLKICWFRHETIGAFEELRRYFQLIEAQLGEVSSLERYVIENQPRPTKKSRFVPKNVDASPESSGVSVVFGKLGGKISNAKHYA